MTRIAVAGASGRMGQAIINVIENHPSAILAGAWEHPESTAIGESVGRGSLTIVASPDAVTEAVDVVIDFTSPEALPHHTAWCVERGSALVIGTTGLLAQAHAGLDTVSATIPVVQAPNMSVGVNVMLAVIQDAARMLGPDYDLEIVETHHRHKVDAPSGTALRLLSALQAVRTKAEGMFERFGQIGARRKEEIGVQTLRGGDVVGEHTVYYYGDGERLEITHRATDRSIFAAGAVRAAIWAASQAPGRYSMSDVLKN